jgi:RHS repeat-associated protein
LLVVNNSPDGVVDYFKAEVITQTDYYPFGMQMPGRTYRATTSYRYGFNGQETDRDVNENFTTALYWEYDSRLGRRWNVDPKPSTSISPYATLFNNPICTQDPLGDTAVIKINGHRQIKYVGNQWIDAKTRVVVNPEDFSKKTAMLMEDYSKLNTIKDFSEVTDKINSASQEVLLTTGGKASHVNLKRFFKGKGIQVQLSMRDKPISEQENSNWKALRLPSYIVMGHELGHVFDLLNGKQENWFSGWKQKVKPPGLPTQTYITIARGEINATYWENVLRVHAKVLKKSKCWFQG